MRLGLAVHSTAQACRASVPHFGRWDGRLNALPAALPVEGGLRDTGGGWPKHSITLLQARWLLCLGSRRRRLQPEVTGLRERLLPTGSVGVLDRCHAGVDQV